MAEWTTLGGGGFDYVQASAPSGAEAGETWLNTSVNPPEQKVYDGNSWTLTDLAQDIKSGRTRELLMLMQDKPVPEVVDPINLQSSLSKLYATSAGDYRLTNEQSGTSVTASISQGGYNSPCGVRIKPIVDLASVSVTVGAGQSTVTKAEVRDDSGNTLATKTGTFDSYSTITFNYQMEAGTTYQVVAVNTDGYDGEYASDNQYPYTQDYYEIVSGVKDGNTIDSGYFYSWEEINVTVESATNGYVTDQFAAPTTAPADFKQWNAIRAEGMTTGGSTSANPVEFEILDSSDTVLTSSRIPASEIADTAFRLRDREYSENAGADGQSGYTVSETGAGGHYGIPILSVVSVENNGSILDRTNWEFDGTDTVTIDTSAVNISSGDTITTSYDLDVFDSTLQPRAYLSRESIDETSPSISHFKYEYVI